MTVYVHKIIYIFDINIYLKQIFYSSDTFAIDADSVTSCYMCGFASMPACISGHPGVRVGNTNICTGRNKRFRFHIITFK